MSSEGLKPSTANRRCEQDFRRPGGYGGAVLPGVSQRTSKRFSGPNQVQFGPNQTTMNVNGLVDELPVLIKSGFPVLIKGFLVQIKGFRS